MSKVNLYHKLAEDKEFRHRFKSFVNMYRGGKEEFYYNGTTIEFVYLDSTSSEDACSTYLIFKFEDRFYRLDGWKSSYGDSEFNDVLDFFEVKQVTKTIIVWE